MERTLVLIKPEGVMRGLIGEVISRIERKGLNLTAIKLLRMSKEQAETLYSMHKTKDFYLRLLNHMTYGPIIAMVVEGPNAVIAIRRIVGVTNPQEADVGSIRADFALNTTQNIVHAADSIENANLEIKIFFEQNEIATYSKPTETAFLLGLKPK
jgi:nucleoside-diphosphate kinase